MKKDFSNFISTLKNSIKIWDYFVNWEKVFAGRMINSNASKIGKIKEVVIINY